MTEDASHGTARHETQKVSVAYPLAPPQSGNQKRSRSLTLRYTILPKMLRILIIGASKNGSKVGIFCETQAENAENFTHPQQLMIKEVIKSQNVGIPQVRERLLFCIQIFVIL